MERKTILIIESIIFCCVLLTPAKGKDAASDDYKLNTEKTTWFERRVGIVNGKVAVPHSWPWQVFVPCNRWEFMCGGTLISYRWVLTAAHCAVDIIPNVDMVYLGAQDITLPESSQQRIYVTDTKIHPKYDVKTSAYDVALLRLKEPAKKNKYVSFASLVNKDWSVPTGMYCTVTGWGDTETGHISRVLRQAKVPISTSNVCKMFFPGIDYPTSFCAGGNDRGAFLGDSGGPLNCKINYIWKQVGIISYGKRVWEPSAPGVYVNVAKVRDFIDNTMRHNGQQIIEG